MRPINTKLITSGQKLKYTNHLGSFISQAEAGRYQILLEMQDKGIISGLQHRVQFTLIDSVHVYKYEKKALKTKTKKVKKKVSAESPVTLQVSFIYYNKAGKLRVEVVKSEKEYKDPAYIIKRKLMRYLHQIVVIEN